MVTSEKFGFFISFMMPSNPSGRIIEPVIGLGTDEPLAGVLEATGTGFGVVAGAGIFFTGVVVVDLLAAILASSAFLSLGSSQSFDAAAFFSLSVVYVP